MTAPGAVGPLGPPTPVPDTPGAARAGAVGRPDALARRDLAVPAARPGAARRGRRRPAVRARGRTRRRARGVRLDRPAGPLALGPARARIALVHEHPVPVPGRPAARAGREPHRRPPPDVRAAGVVARRRADRPAAGRRRVARTGVGERSRRRLVDGQSAGRRVRRHRPPPPRHEHRRAARGAVVAGQLPRGPGPVVAPRGLPVGHPRAPAAPRPRRRLRGRRPRPVDGSRHARRRDGHHRPGGHRPPRRGRPGGAGRPRHAGPAGRRSGRPLVGGDTPALRPGRGHPDRDGPPARRVPSGRGRRRPTARERRAPGVPRGEPARDAPGPRSRLRRGGGPRRPVAHEAARRAGHPHRAPAAAPALPRARRRVRLLGGARVRPRDTRLLGGRLGRQPLGGPRVAGRLPRPRPADGGTGQEPPVRRHVVARQRVRHGANLAAMAEWIRRRDPSRPIHYEGDTEGAYTDVYSRMYPTLEEIDSVCGTVTMPVHEVGPAAGARQRAKPFVLCEYGHAMGNGPGRSPTTRTASTAGRGCTAASSGSGGTTGSGRGPRTASSTSVTAATSANPCTTVSS